MFQLKYGKIVLKFAFISRLSKICEVPMHLIFAVEAHNLVKNCTKWYLIDNKFKKYANIWILVTIATWLIQGYPYPQSSRFHS